LEELAALESFDNGQTLSTAKFIDVGLSIDCYRYFAGWADKIHGKVINTETSKFAYTRHEPIGVCAAIIP
ncbi:13990_t:CDS:2, partial [Gigaspora rosea]